jgi:hypothetical protein
MINNIWWALREDAISAIAGWSDLTPEQQLVKIAIESHPDSQHISNHSKRDVVGGKQWEMFSVYTDNVSALMATISNIFQTPNNSIILGVWNMDGTQEGTFYDTNGVLAGTPTYPQHPRVKKFMPDDVTYDVNGAETGRSLAIGPKQMNVLMHTQSNRNFT